MPSIPRVHPAFDLHVRDADTVFALSEARRTVLRLPGLGELVSRIDGVRTLSAIVDQLDGRMPAAAVHDTIEALAARGYLSVAGATATALPMAAPIEVSVLATADIGPQRRQHWARQLQEAGIVVVSGDAADAALRIVLTGDLRHPELLAWCEQAEREGARVLPVKPDGLMPSIGPLLGEADRACVHCLRYWIGTQRPMETWLARAQASSPADAPFVPTPVVHDPVTESLSLQMLATLLRRTHAANSPGGPAGTEAALPRELLALDLRSMATSRHAVTRRPQCPHCGNPRWMQEQAWRPPELTPLPSPISSAISPTISAGQQASGTRRQSAQETFAQYRHLVSPVTGPVCYLHPMPGRHGGMRHVYVSGYMVCPEPDDPDFVTDKVCAGKGSTEEQARTSALCEALERWSGAYQGDEARTRASLSELAARGETALPFNTLQQFSHAQFAQRAQINARARDPRRQVPEPFHYDAPIDWTPAWSLTHSAWRQVPLTYCYAQAPQDSGRAFGIHNPNGTAAGTSIAEALLQGTLELIERDATAIWWYNRLPRPGIDLASFGDPYFTQLVEDYAKLGWQLWALDLTHDLRIPACVAVAWHPADDRHALGFGCHVDPHLALRRALTECNQLFDPSSRGPDPWDRTLLPETAFLHPLTTTAGAVQAVDAEQMRRTSRHSAGADPLDSCRQALAEQGLEWLMVDKTRPDIGLKVVQAIVPGLRHFWPRLGPGRLYDVPVAMGWLGSAMPEEALNPAPLFL